eukprot:NODE_170_length_14437_cov_1.447273.p7 type:complete len:241 gc:universal NODE_170_length_14437_cov_1.447273:13970-13248(-)
MDDLSSLLQSLPSKVEKKDQGRFTQALDELKRAGEQADVLTTNDPAQIKELKSKEPFQDLKSERKTIAGKQTIVELCRGCGLPITKLDHEQELALLIADTLPFHRDCLKCAACDTKLVDEIYDLQGHVYCLEHYEEICNSKCGYCDELITDSYITALEKKWHPEHFFCSHCGNTFEDGQFMENEGKPYCKPHYLQLFAVACAKCAKPISDEGLNALNQMFHASCFTCFVIFIYLAMQSTF